MEYPSPTTTYIAHPTQGVLHLQAAHSSPSGGAAGPQYLPRSPRRGASYGGASPNMAARSSPAEYAHYHFQGQEPANPPPLIHGLSPYARVPLPRSVDTRVTIHPTLDYGSPFLIAYDIAMSPSSASPTAGYRTRSSGDQWLFQPATKPSMRSITIRLQALEKPIIVHATDYTAVTINDVLTAVHNAVRVAVAELTRPAHFSGLWASEYEHYQYAHRFLNYSTPEAYARALRELLIDRRHWAGLTPSDTETEVWILYIR